MKMTRLLLIATWFVASSSLGSPTICEADTPVALHGDGAVHGATVRLSDLFSGVPSIIDRDIAQAPPPGRSATYDAPLLEKLADKYRLEWHASDPTDHVTLNSPATRITGDDIREAVMNKIKESGVHGEIDMTFDNREMEVDLPATQTADFNLENFSFDPASKRFRADLTAARGSVSVPVAGRVSIHRRVPVLAHHLDVGSIIEIADIDWAMVNDDRVTPSVVTDADELVGHEIRHALNDGDLLHLNDVMPARLVTRGSLVTLKIETSFMQLTAQGRSLQDGAEGDTVRVNNTQSGRMVEGTVTGPGEVTVRSGGPKLASVE